MKAFIAIWFTCTVSLAVAGGVFAGLFALGLRAPFIGPAVAVTLMLCIQSITPAVRKVMKP